MRAVIIVDNGVQDEEFLYPYYRLQEEHFQLDIAAKSDVKGKYGIPIKRTMSTDDLCADNFDCVVIPGGWESPEKIRQDEKVLQFLQQMHQQKKTIGAICHGPQVLISAKIVAGKRMTCYKGMKDDLINAGATFVDGGLVVDENLITSPHYRNNPEFVKEVIKNTGNTFDYANITVSKPWGHEFLVYQNNKVGVWCLVFNQGQKTSLHSHPKKKTGLIVLCGKAEVSFLNGKHLLKPGEKVMIRNGVFHSTEAKSDLVLLEVETPNDKHDIIRLEDAYGRSGQPYEGADHHLPKNEHWDLGKGHRVGLCHIKERTFTDREELLNLPDCKIIITSGGINYQHHPVLSCGDVVDNAVMSRLAGKFEADLPLKTLIIFS